MNEKNEKRILQAIEQKDIQYLQHTLKNPVGYLLDGKSVLSVAVAKGGWDTIKFLIDAGCDIRHVDTNGDTAWHHFCKRIQACTRQVYRHICADCEMKSNRINILEIFLAAYSGDDEALFSDVFLNVDQSKMTPFLLACKSRCDDVVLRLLPLIENRSISIDKFIDLKGDNLFHFLVNSSAIHTELARAETIPALIDKIPFSGQLIDATNADGKTPLFSFFFSGNCHDWRDVAVVEVAKTFLNNGATPDPKFLNLAIRNENASVVELLLRAGCCTDPYDDGRSTSPMCDSIKFAYRWRRPRSELIRVIELFLAFGVDLQKELYLYTFEELPEEFDWRNYDKLCDPGGVDPDILEALRELRRSNKLAFSLQRQCRNTIRSHLKHKADEVIRNLSCLPDQIKSYLLIENQAPVLGILD